MDRPRFDHLRALTDHNGLFEHAQFDVPRRDHGYCVDDVSRALIVVGREPEQTADLAELAETYLRFLEGAVGLDGLAHNRMRADGTWADERAMGDWWGRLLWALGTTAAHAPDASSRDRALRAFHRAAQQRTPDRRTIAFAALGAAEVVAVMPADRAARGILLDLVAAVPPTQDPIWPWPEGRLEYANAVIPEALIAAGEALGDTAVTERGLHLLAFLLALETTGDRLSVTGSAGRGPGEQGPLFDQQSIEVAALADACARAFATTGDTGWIAAITMSWAWFTGLNDSEASMFDDETGAGFDGLMIGGRNENRGAESTLAALSTYQQARRAGRLVPA